MLNGKEKKRIRKSLSKEVLSRQVTKLQKTTKRRRKPMTDGVQKQNYKTLLAVLFEILCIIC